MRTIKFRAWDTEAKEMLFGGNFQDIATEPDKERWFFGIDVENHPDFIELMQFTGLLDKNGVEVYEGDITEYEPLSSQGGVFGKSRHLVSYEAPRFMITNPDDVRWGGYQNLEVVGNIYENPELLK